MGQGVNDLHPQVQEGGRVGFEILLEGAKIDWEMLREQKLSLLEVLDLIDSLKPGGLVTVEQKARYVPDLSGLVYLLDYMQDAAVEAGYPEYEIFNLPES
jgi:hypothetical protein